LQTAVQETSRNVYSHLDGRRFWIVQFTATQATATGFQKVDPLDYMTRNVVVVPEPTVFLDPEAFYYDQADKAQREKFAIKYARNTILMCRNKPMLWQWWL
jgi:hypothetical protein